MVSPQAMTAMNGRDINHNSLFQIDKAAWLTLSDPTPATSSEVGGACEEDELHSLIGRWLRIND